MRAIQEDSISSVYGEAFFNMAQKKGCIDSLYEEASSLLNYLGEGKSRFALLLKAPHITAREKMALISGELASFFSEEMLRFLEVVIEMGRSFSFDSILGHFIVLVDRFRGVESIVIETAIELLDEEKVQIQRALEKMMKKKLILSFSLNKEILGGVLVKTGNLFIDDTLKGHLKRLTHHLY